MAVRFELPASVSVTRARQFTQAISKPAIVPAAQSVDTTGVKSLRQEKGASQKIVSKRSEESLDIQLQKRIVS
jgi:hypothetical protein